MFDAHCHLHDARIGQRADELMERASRAGVTGMLLAGVDPPGWDDEVALARRFPDRIALSFGIHPQVVAELAQEAGGESRLDRYLGALVGYLEGGHGAVCIGEIGLDGARGRNRSFAVQERLFAAQLELAKWARLPVALHVLDAHGRALALAARVGLPDAGGMVHSFSGSAEVARDWMSLGLHISFAGSVSDPRAQRVRRAAASVPDARLLLESDAPDQTPAPHRSTAPHNEPAFLVANLEALAQIRGQSVQELAALTERNARALFHLPSQGSP